MERKPTNAFVKPTSDSSSAAFTPKLQGYRPDPVRRRPTLRVGARISKEGGGERLLGIPNVLDRLIQQATCQVLTPIFDPEFSESSFGFRPGRSAHGAAKRVQQIIRQGHPHCVDVDLSKFFDRVQHDVLMCRVSRKDRYIPLPQSTLRVLRALWATHGNPTFLFPAEGRNHQFSTVQGAIKQITKQLNFGKKVTTHTLRHSYATHLLEAGVSLRAIQKWKVIDGRLSCSIW